MLFGHTGAGAVEIHDFSSEVADDANFTLLCQWCPPGSFADEGMSVAGSDSCRRVLQRARAT